MKCFRIIFVSVAICLIIIAIVGVNKNINKNQDDTRWITKEVYVDSNDMQIAVGAVPTWEYRSITEKFYSLEFLENNYSTRNTKIEKSFIEEKLGAAVLKGYDIYAEKEHSIGATIYKVKDFPEECVIALQFENDADYYVYINAYYRPETLGQFIEDLNLKETVYFGSVWYEYSDKDEQDNYHYEKIEFPEVTDEIIWQMLFDNLITSNVHNDFEVHDRIMSISVNMPLFGYENISVSVSEDGYLTTNIFDTGKTFYIGKDKVEAFVNYVLENYQGYKIVYIYENDDERVDKKEDNNVIEEIIMVENKLDGTKFTSTYEYNGTSISGSNSTEPYNPNDK